MRCFRFSALHESRPSLNEAKHHGNENPGAGPWTAWTKKSLLQFTDCGLGYSELACSFLDDWIFFCGRERIDPRPLFCIGEPLFGLLPLQSHFLFGRVLLFRLAHKWRKFLFSQFEL